jgi:hypothetical protein
LGEAGSPRAGFPFHAASGSANSPELRRVFGDLETTVATVVHPEQGSAAHAVTSDTRTRRKR